MAAASVGPRSSGEVFVGPTRTLAPVRRTAFSPAIWGAGRAVWVVVRVPDRPARVELRPPADESPPVRPISNSPFGTRLAGIDREFPGRDDLLVFATGVSSEWGRPELAARPTPVTLARSAFPAQRAKQGRGRAAGWVVNRPLCL